MDFDSGLLIGLDTFVQTDWGRRPYINFDNAATTPSFAEVLKRVNDFMPWYSSVHRGNGIKSRMSSEAYDEAHATVLDFVGANPTDHVAIFGKNTTEAINKLSYRLGLRKKDVVLISHLEHHSNDLPWRARATVVRIGLDATGGIDRDDYVRLLQRYAGRVKLVAISGASNVTGHLPDIHWFAREAHAAKAEIFVDCAQLASHRPINMKRYGDPEGLDYIAFSAHKMYAPFGTGVLVGRKDIFNTGKPEYVGGGTITSVTTKYVDFAKAPASDEAGSPNVVGAVALAEAIRVFKKIGFDKIAQHETALTTYALLKLQDNPAVKVYGDHDPYNATARIGVIPFTFTGVPAPQLAEYLGFRCGIGVRDGCFCAQPYVTWLMGKDENRVRHDILHKQHHKFPGLVRISFGIYNTCEEIDMLAEALQSARKLPNN